MMYKEEIIKIVYIKNIINDLWKKKFSIGLIILACVVILGFTGYSKAKNSYFADTTQLEEYNHSLENYNLVISELEGSIAVAETQVNNLAEYCDNSIYMQLDSQNIQIASAQYQVATSANITYILNAWTAYINEGSLKEEIEKKTGISTEYLKEIILCSTSGNVLMVSAMHYDGEQAQELLRTIEEILFGHKTQIEQSQGVFELKELNRTFYSKADTNVLNTQNTHLNNLKAYKLSLSDLEKKLIDQKTNQKNFVENNKPEILVPQNPIKAMIKYSVFGILVGCMLPVVAYLLRDILSDKVKSRKEFMQGKIPVFGIWNSKEGYTPELNRSCFEIQLLAEKQMAKKIFFNIVGKSEELERVEADYKEQLKKQELLAESGNDILNSDTELRKMVEAGNCIIVIEAGRTTYSQIEEQRQLCNKFNIPVWGYIIIE